MENNSIEGLGMWNFILSDGMKDQLRTIISNGYEVTRYNDETDIVKKGKFLVTLTRPEEGHWDVDLSAVALLGGNTADVSLLTAFTDNKNVKIFLEALLGKSITAEPYNSKGAEDHIKDLMKMSPAISNDFLRKSASVCGPTDSKDDIINALMGSKDDLLSDLMEI